MGLLAYANFLLAEPASLVKEDLALYEVRPARKKLA